MAFHHSAGKPGRLRGHDLQHHILLADAARDHQAFFQAEPLLKLPRQLLVIDLRVLDFDLNHPGFSGLRQQQGNRRPRGPQLFGDGFLGQALLIIHFSRLYHLLQILNTVSPIHAISFRPRPAPAGFPAKQARLNQSLPIEQYRAILLFLVFSNFLFALPSV